MPVSWAASYQTRGGQPINNNSVRRAFHGVLHHSSNSSSGWKSWAHVGEVMSANRIMVAASTLLVSLDPSHNARGCIRGWVHCAGQWRSPRARSLSLVFGLVTNVVVTVAFPTFPHAGIACMGSPCPCCMPTSIPTTSWTSSRVCSMNLPRYERTLLVVSCHFSSSPSPLFASGSNCTRTCFFSYARHVYLIYSHLEPSVTARGQHPTIVVHLSSTHLIVLVR